MYAKLEGDLRLVMLAFLVRVSRFVFFQRGGMNMYERRIARIWIGPTGRRGKEIKLSSMFRKYRTSRGDRAGTDQ